MDRESHRAAVEAGYASLAEYIEKWEPTMVEATQKRYADDVTLQELVRLRVEIERLREQERKMTDHALERMEEIERLREALKPFAEIADDWDHLDDEDYVSVHKYDIELRHFRAIRSALQQKETE